MPSTPSPAAMRLVRADGPLDPVLKWPGGKRQERGALLADWPTTAGRYLEPFVGGGAMWLATSPDVPAAVNDASEDLVALYRAAADADWTVFAVLDQLATWWAALGGLGDLVADLAELHPAAAPPVEAVALVLGAHGAALLADVPDGLASSFLADLATGVPRKLARMQRVEGDRGVRLPPADVLANVEGALRAAAYTTIRRAYNVARAGRQVAPMRTAAFFVLRELAYAAMFRFNADGDFNVPYGGITYNARDLTQRVAGLQAPDLLERLETTDLHEGDFAAFLDVVGPVEDDFVFLDPPYLSDFRDYDGRGFGPADHRRLADCLRGLPCRFQLVVKATPEVRDWYAADHWSVREVDKTYAWTIKSRNERRVTHLVIENR